MMLNIPAAEYHAARGLYMTSHRLIAARRSMADFIEDARNPRPDSDALYFGRSAHVYILEGPAAFWAQYVVGGPVNPKTGKTFGSASKTYQEWAKDQPLPAITPEELERIERINASVRNQNAARQLLAQGTAEVTGRTEIVRVPCQARLDWLTGDDRIVDLKTCGDLSTIAVDCEQYGYIIQQAFYRQVVERLTGKRMPCYLIWAEKADTAQSVVWRLDDDRLDHEARENERVIEEVREVFFQLAKERPSCQQELSSKTSTPKAPPKAHRAEAASAT